MKKCEYSFIYEQVGDNKLITCRLPKGECGYQGKTFNSSANSTKYVICNKKGLAKKMVDLSDFQEFFEQNKCEELFH